jgi:Large ribosomal RNA subunit accumulation protein YceD
MPKLLMHSPENPEFARILTVASLRRMPEFRFDLAPEPAEAEAIAALLGAQSLPELRFEGTLRPEGDGWRLDARLVGVVVQTCVVSLAPVTTRVDAPVRRRFEPGGAPRGAEIEVDAFEDDEREPLGERIDLGLVALEALALALPEYPRAEGAALREADLAALGLGGAEEAGPFAGLAALRGKLRDDR